MAPKFSLLTLARYSGSGTKFKKSFFVQKIQLGKFTCLYFLVFEIFDDLRRFPYMESIQTYLENLANLCIIYYFL